MVLDLITLSVNPMKYKVRLGATLFIIDGPKHPAIAQVRDYDNAHLFASSPEMLAMLKKCLKFIKTNHPKPHFIKDQIQDVINLSKGIES